MKTEYIVETDGVTLFVEDSVYGDDYIFIGLDNELSDKQDSIGMNLDEEELKHVLDNLFCIYNNLKNREQR